MKNILKTVRVLLLALTSGLAGAALADMEYVTFTPTAVENAAAAVWTNGVQLAEAESYVIESNVTTYAVQVVYTAADGYVFLDATSSDYTTAKTNNLDTAKDPVVLKSGETLPAAPQLRVQYTMPVYKTAGVPASGIDHWVTNAVLNPTVVTSSLSTWGEDDQTTWYVLKDAGVSRSSAVTCLGDVHLILCEGASMSVSGYPAIKTKEASLTVYGQPDGAGSLTAQGKNWSAGIGDEDYGYAGAFTMYGGNVTAIGGTCGPGIGSFYGAGTTVIAGGVLTATGGDGAAAIGFGSYGGYTDGSVTIVGGELNLTPGSNAKSAFQNASDSIPTVFIGDGYWSFDVEAGWIAADRVIYPMSNSKYKCLVAKASKTFAAQVGDAIYKTFDAAVAAAKALATSAGSATISLVGDCSSTGAAFGDYEIDLELNGKTLTLSGTLSIAGAGGVLNVSDSSSASSGRVISSGAFTASDGATIALSGGTYGFDPSAMLAPNRYVKAGAGTWTICCSAATANGVTVTTTDGSVRVDEATGAFQLTMDGAYVATGENTDGTATIAATATATTLTLTNLVITDAQKTILDFAAGEHTILLAGTNTLGVSCNGAPAVHVTTGVKVTLDAASGCALDNALLQAQGGYYGAAIGGGAEVNEWGDFESGEAVGEIVLAGGWIQACGGEYGAAIGGGRGSEGGSVTVSGGVVEATGGEYGAAIGAGAQGSATSIYVTGGEQLYPMAGSGATGLFQSRDAKAPVVLVSPGFYTFDVEKTWVAAGSTIYALFGFDYACYVAGPTEPAYVATVDGTAMCETFDAAAAAAKMAAASAGSSTIMLVADADGTGTDFGAYGITLELNGKTLSLDGTLAVTAAGGSLAVQDTLLVGRLTTTGGAFTKVDGATISLSGGTYNFDPTPFLASADYGVLVDAGAGTWTVAHQKAEANGVTVTTTDGEVLFDAETGLFTLVRVGSYVATGENTDGTATIAATATATTLTLTNLVITDAQKTILDFAAGEHTILLAGTNTLGVSCNGAPAVHVTTGVKVTLDAASGCALDNALLQAQGGYYGAAIGGGAEVNEWGDFESGEAVGEIVLAGGWIQACGGEYGAAIGGGRGSEGGSVTVSGGVVEATGGYYGAAIGGGMGSTGGSVTVSGGVVEATGGYCGAAIGAGTQGSAASIYVTGGELYPTAGSGATGLFQSRDAKVPVVQISPGFYTFDVEKTWVAAGSTIYALSGLNYVCYVAGPAEPAYVATVDGTAMYETFDAAAAAAKTAAASAGSSTIVLVADAEGTGTDFGAYGITLELNGKTLSLDGTLAVTAAGGSLAVQDALLVGRLTTTGGAFTKVDGATISLSGGTYNFNPTPFLASADYGVLVDAAAGTWTVAHQKAEANGVTVTTTDGEVLFDAETGLFTLVRVGAYVATGTNTEGTARITGTVDGATLTLKNLDIEKAQGSIIDFDSVALTVLLEGTNTLTMSCESKPAIRAENQTRLTIDAAPGCDLSNAMLTVQSSYNAAGIGGGYDNELYAPETVGEITIKGGWIVAYGGSRGAGIGGGERADAGVITITGGRIEAQGGYGAAGIGGGSEGNGGVITITGASVAAYSRGAPGLGAGSGGVGGVLTFEGDVYAKDSYGGQSLGSSNWDDYDRGTITVGEGLYKMEIDGDFAAEGLVAYPAPSDADYVSEVAPYGTHQVGLFDGDTFVDFYETLAEAFAAADQDYGVKLYVNNAESVTTPADKLVYFDGNGFGFSGTFTVGAGGVLGIIGGKFVTEPAASFLPDGYHALANKEADRLDYPYYVRYVEASLTHGTTTIYYNSIARALAAAESGDVVAVMKSGGWDSQIEPAISGLILDLNGCAITNTASQAVNIQNRTFTIRDSAGGGRLVGTGERAVYLQNGTLNIEGGTIEGVYYGVYVNDSGSSTVNVSGGTVAATQDNYPAIRSAPFTHLNISGGTFRGFVVTCLETDAYVAEYGTPDGYTRTTLDLTGYAGDTITNCVYGQPTYASPTPGIAFAEGVAYADLLEPADYEGNTGSAAFGGEMSFAYDNVAQTWSITAPSVALTWVDEDGTTPITDVMLTEATKNGQITLPVVYREGKLLTEWNGSTPQTAYTVSDATTFQATWATVPFAGSGSPTDPFRITNFDDLTNLVAYANAGGVAAQRLYATFALTVDIDVSSVENWTPIAQNSSAYWGATFDGQGFAVSNLTCVGNRYLGLFGYISGGRVQNLTVANVAITNTVTESYYTEDRGSGAVAGWMQEGAVVSNCTVSGSVFANINCCAISPAAGNTKITDCDTTALNDIIDKAHTMYASYTTTNLCGWLEQEGYSMDVIGRAKGNWVKTTYSNGGYRYKTYGLGDAKVTKKCVPMSGGRFTKFIYTVTAGTQAIVGGRVGLGCDTQVGDDDGATLSVIRDTDGNVMGLRMICHNTYSALCNDQYNLYFRGVAGCTDATTYWFGYYGNWENNWMNPLNQSTAHGDYRFNENGEYEELVNTDSGLALSWEVNLEPGKTATYACAFGIGEKSDPPRWNEKLALTKVGRKVYADAKITNESGLKVMLYGQCAPDMFGGEQCFDTVRALGEDKPVAVQGVVDTTGWADGLYVLTYWLVNEYGAMSESVRKPIQIKDDEVVLDIGGDGYYLLEGQIVTEDTEQFTSYECKVFALGDHTKTFPSVITKDGYFYAIAPAGEYDVSVTATPSDPTLNPVETIVLVHVENDTSDIQVQLENPTSREINSKLVDLTSADSQFHGFLVGDLDTVARKMGEAREDDFTLSIIGQDAGDTDPHADEMRTLGVRGDEFRDINYVRFGFAVSNESGEVALDTVPRTATVVLPFLYARSGELEVYRWNDKVGAMEQITSEKNADGEYFEIYSDDAVLVSIVKGGLYGLAFNLDRHLTVDGIDIGIAQGLGWTCVSNNLVFTGAGEYLWRGTNDVPLKSVSVGGAYIKFTAGETQVSITNVSERPTWLPQGYNWNWDEATQVGTSYEFEPVARIVVTKDDPNLYETLDEALAADDAAGRTVEVLKDCTFTKIEIAAGCTNTLDASGFLVEGDPTTVSVGADARLKIIGGTYNFDPTVWVPVEEGYGVRDNRDGTWTVLGSVKVTCLANWGGYFEGKGETNVVTIMSGETTSGFLAPTPTNGLVFIGWYRDAACTRAQADDRAITEDMTIYAGYVPGVVYDAAGGVFADGAAEQRIVCEAGVYILPTETPTRTDYTFLGWYEGVTNDARKIAAGDAVAVLRGFAKWESKQIEPATPGAEVVSGSATADGQGLVDVKPTQAYASGNVAIPDRTGDTAGSRAIVGIADSAFTPRQYGKLEGATPIVSVTIPTFVTSIGKYAFWGNDALTSVTFSPAYSYLDGSSVEVVIKNYAFANTAITNVTFPVGGRYRLCNMAFAHNPQLKDVWILGDVTLESLSKSPFREVGEGCGGTTFHLSPALMTNTTFVAALTNGLHAVKVREADPSETVSTLSDTPAGAVTTGVSVGVTTITATFTLPADAPWKTVTTETVSLLFSQDVAKLVAGDCQRIFATRVVQEDDGSYTATFAKPEGDTGFFTVCVGN